MLEQLLGELQPAWDWILTQLGWEGIQLSWVHILVLALAFIGALVILRNLIGGHSGGGGGSTIVYPPSRRWGGLPTRHYVGRDKLSDFSISPKVYDFRVPTSTPNLSKLREPVKLDMEKARELYIPGSPGTRRSEAMARAFQLLYGRKESRPKLGSTSLDMGGERRVAANGGGTSQPATSSFKPDWESARELFVTGKVVDCPHEVPARFINWELARKLFVPRIGRR